MQLFAGRLNQRHHSLVSARHVLLIRYCDDELRNVAFRLDAMLRTR